jgi:sec-independent protein translocase protein TatC
MKRTKSKPTKKRTKSQTPKRAVDQITLPFMAHVAELRRRLFYIAIAILIGGGAAYSVQLHITNALLKPAGTQQFIYTSPGGGFDFLFRLCMYAGILFALPVIVYQLLRYLQPLIKREATRFIAWGSIASVLLAVVGVLFGYFVGLPAAMHFLLNQFSTDKIHALLTIQSYTSFVMMYLLGSAILFQVPLVMLLINKVKPQRPRKLMGFQRWFIVFAFIAGGIISPSPNIQDQLMLAVPMVLMYQIGILLVWLTNRSRNKSQKVLELIHKDAELRASRLNNFQQAQETWLHTVQTAIKPADATPKRILVTLPPSRPAAAKVATPAQPAPRPALNQPNIPLPNTIIRPTRAFAADVAPTSSASYRPIRVSLQE